MSFRSSRLSHQQKKSLLNLSKKIIGINSTNSHGNLHLARFIGVRLKKVGFRVSYQRALLGGVKQANLIARIGPKKGKPLLINTHLDTVVTHPKQWTKTGKNPFRATLKGGTLYGLGVADTKLALACQLIALEEINLKELRRPLMITGTYGEELGLVGVQKLIKSSKLEKSSILNSEPTELRPANGNKGFRVYQITGRLKPQDYSHVSIYCLYFRGKAAHSAIPRQGRNAIIQALKWVRIQKNQIGICEMHGGLEANVVAPSCEVVLFSRKPLSGDLRRYGGKIIAKRKIKKINCRPLTAQFIQETLNFLKSDVPTGETHNLGKIKVEKGCLEILMDHRFGPRINPNTLKKQLQTVLGRAGSRDGNSYSLRLLRDNPPFYQPRKGRLVYKVLSILKLIRKRPKLWQKPGCTEAGYFAKGGSEVLTIGPGVAYGNAHQPNESIRVKELEEAVVFYREMIKKMCL